MRESSLLNFFHYFKTFHRYVGKKLYVLIFVITLAGYMDGFGISMMIPLLSFNTGQSEESTITKAFHDLFDFLGIHFSFVNMLIFIAIIFSLKEAFFCIQKIMKSYIDSHIFEHFQKIIANKYDKMKYSFYINTDIGFFNNIITTECRNATTSLNGFIHVLHAMIGTVTYLCFALFINYPLTLMIIVFGFFSQIIYRRIREKVAESSLELSQKNADIQNTFIQYISNFKYLKIVSRHFNFLGKLFKDLNHYRRLQFKIGSLNAATNSSLELSKVIILIGTMYFFVVHRGQSIILVLVPFFLINKFISEILKLQMQWQVFCSSIGGIVTLEKAQTLLDENYEDIQGIHVNGIHQEIILRNVSFSFGTKKILSEINMEIPLHTCVGIIGESGAGKSTLLDIITGLLPACSGQCKLDGVPYEKLNKNDLRSLFGYITQETVIFNDTIANNITLWNYNRNDQYCQKKIRDAAHIAHCVNFITDKEDGYETVVGDKGIRLSGGQRQRICIAREIFRNSEILIFDEATASLDSESEHYIQQSMEKFLGKKTMIIVTHRLSTLRNKCDMIYVLSQGKIIERGSWEELNRTDGSIFSRMYQTQKIDT